MNQVTQQLGIDFAKFDDLKQSGACRVVRLATDHFAVVVRTFDQFTGMEAKPTILQCDLAGIANQVKLLDGQIDLLTKQRAGLQALHDEMSAADAAEAQTGG